MIRSSIAAAFALGLVACSGSSSTGDLGGGSSGPFGGVQSPGKDGGSGASGSSSGGGSSTSGGGSSTSGGSSSGATSQCTQTGNAACDACVNQSCCPAIQACEQNAQCIGLYQCLGACAQNDPTCSDQCLGQYGGGKTMLQSALSCIDQACAGKC